MAVVMMGGDQNNNNSDKNPIFHDFLGMSCPGGSPSASFWAKSGGGGGGGEGSGGDKAVEAEASVSAASMGASSGGHGLVSERRMVDNFEGFDCHSRRSDISVPEDHSKFSGRKRSNSDSAFMGLMKDRMFPMISDSPESTRLVKMFGKEVMSEHSRRSGNAEMMFGMQPQRKPVSSSLIFHPPLSGRHDPVISKWERSMSMNAGQMLHHPSRLSQGGATVDKVSPCSYRDPNAGAVVISQAAADEGSRTGIKGAGILNIINPSGSTVERNSPALLPSSNMQRISSHITGPESSSMQRHGTTTPTRQMTIFYAGQAHVFDDVHPNKADVIMALAGSNGGSWSTTYDKSSARSSNSEAKAPYGENDASARVVSFLHNLNPRLPVQMRSHPQVTGVPVTGEMPNFSVTGGHQGGRDVRDARPTNLTDANGEGKRKL